MHAALRLLMVLLLAVPPAAGADQWKVAPGGQLPQMLQERLQRDIPGDATGTRALLLHFSDCRSGLCLEALRSIAGFVAPPGEQAGLAVAVIVSGKEADRIGQLQNEYRENGFTFLPDPSGEALRSVSGRAAVPLTLFLDGEGRVVYQHAGYSPGREAEFRYVAETLLAGDPLPRHLSPAHRREPATPPARAGGTRDLMGKPAPELHVEGWINHPPEDRAGRFTLVEFWATWCGPCIATMNLAEKLHEEFEARLVTLAISDEGEGTIRPVVEERNWRQPIGYDTKGRTMRAIEIHAIPAGYLVDPEGTVVWQGHPAELWLDDARRLRELLDSGG